MKILHLLVLLIIIILLFYFINKNLIKYENFANEISNSYLPPENLDYILPKEIYCYWDNIENNDLVKAHINTWKRNISKDWKINIISKDNINEYVDKDFIKKYGDLSPVRFSDFLRVDLLTKKGGVWIDATTIIVNGEFLNIYYNEMIKNKYDVTFYEFKQHSL
jgi:mannosyltransferase OCH1-like enzyme